MSLTKLARTTFVPGHDAVAYQPYSRTCPAPAPGSPTNPIGSSSGGISGCAQVPIYGVIATAVQGSSGYDQTVVYSYGIIGYYEVCG